jgi:hypothetical protein
VRPGWKVAPGAQEGNTGEPKRWLFCTKHPLPGEPTSVKSLKKYENEDEQYKRVNLTKRNTSR